VVPLTFSNILTDSFGWPGAKVQLFLSLSLCSLCERKELVKEELKIYKKTSKILKLFFNVFKNMLAKNYQKAFLTLKLD
jgi:hypothetical protein